MFIPFIFTLTPEDDLRYLWIFYKYLGFAKKFNWPMISQAKYYEDPDKYENMGRSEVSKFTDILEYERPTEHDISLIQKYVIPDCLFDELLNKLGSQSDSWIFILKNRYEPLEKCLRDIFNEIVSKNQNEKIEGILTFASFPSLLQVCNEQNIPVIHNEIGPLRNPSYRLTAYLDFKGLFGNSELEDRYNKFCSEIQTSKCPILSRKEILSLFLNYENMDMINSIDSEPEFEMGIATQYAMDFSVLNYSLNSNLELILMAKRYYNENELILRMHPGDTSFSNYKTVKNIDTSKSSMEFIIKSKRVAVISSNVAFEAMLWGRTAYTTGKCAYSFKAIKNLSDKQENVVDIDFVNFVVFAYLIPYELVTDEKYLRWRLTRPSEIEIYYYHLNYYLSCRGIDKDQLALPSDQRLYAFLESQGFDASGEILQNEGANKRLILILKEAEKITEQNFKAKYLITKIHQLMRVNQNLKVDISNLYERIDMALDKELELENTVKQRDEHINAMLAYVSELEGTVKQRDERINETLAYVSELEGTVKQRNERINETLAYASELEGTVKQRDERINETLAYVSELEGTVKQRDERINETLAYVSELEGTVKQRDERTNEILAYVSELESKIKQRDERIGALDKFLNEIQKTIAYKVFLKLKFTNKDH